MEPVNPPPLQMAIPYELEEDGVEEEVGQKRNLGEVLEWRRSTSRTGELTIAFEGEVYVFPAVSPQKVQAVLLLLGGSDAPSSVPSSEFLLQQNSQSISDMSQGSKLSRRFASLVRFREKRKERCFEKKIRYTCRKEVAQRMHRKNGQFASLKDCETTDVEKWEPSNGSVLPDTVPRSCQNCGTSEKATPAMRRGPAGPRTLCNACGLMWANKGTLRDLTKGGRHSFDQNEPGTPDVKPSAIGRENSYVNQDEEGSPEDNKPLPLDSEIYVKPHEQWDMMSQNHSTIMSLYACQEFLEADENLANPIPMHVENSSITLDEEVEFQGTLDELGNVSVSEFEIPGNFDDQVDVGDSNAVAQWRPFGDDAPSP